MNILATVKRAQRLQTREGIEAEIGEMASEAVRCSGQADALYARTFSEQVDKLLLQLDECWITFAVEIALDCGYATTEERAASDAEIAARGACPRTGIDPDCCPCGWHE